MVPSSKKRTRSEKIALRVKVETLRKKGWSYKEIRRVLPVPKATLSGWCRSIQLTKEQKERLKKRYDTQLRGAKANQTKSKERREEIRRIAAHEVAVPDKQSLKIAGAMLYWAEGSKTHHTALANSDPALIVFFVRWLKDVLNIAPAQLSVQLHLHRGQNDATEKLYWSRLTGIPLEKFTKTYYKPKGTGHRGNRLYHGTVRIRATGIGSTLLRETILGWVEGFIQHYVPKNLGEVNSQKRVASSVGRATAS